MNTELEKVFIKENNVKTIYIDPGSPWQRSSRNIAPSLRMGPKGVSQIKMASLRASTDDSGMSASIGNSFVWRLSRASHLRFAQTAFGMTTSSRQSLIWTLTEDRVVIEDYRNVPSEATSPSQQTWTYNTFRPHNKLAYLSPSIFAARKTTPSPFPVGLRLPYAGDGQQHINPLQP